MNDGAGGCRAWCSGEKEATDAQREGPKEGRGPADLSHYCHELCNASEGTTRVLD